MAALVSFLVFCQALGASVGALTALWSEFAYVRAMRDGKIDVAERAHLDIIAKGLRFGMALLLLASLGLVIVAYVVRAIPQPALTPSYWTLIVLALLVIGVSLALSRRRISFTLGSAIVFTAWWLLCVSHHRMVTRAPLRFCGRATRCRNGSHAGPASLRPTSGRTPCAKQELALGCLYVEDRHRMSHMNQFLDQAREGNPIRSLSNCRRPTVDPCRVVVGNKREKTVRETAIRIPRRILLLSSGRFLWPIRKF